MNRFLRSALTAAVTGAVSALCLPGTPHAAASDGPACALRCAAGASPGAVSVQWVAVPRPAGCTPEDARDACHLVTVAGSGVDCDPGGCFIPGGATSWSQSMELEAVSGMYVADPPPASLGP